MYFCVKVYSPTHLHGYSLSNVDDLSVSSCVPTWYIYKIVYIIHKCVFAHVELGLSS